MKELLVELLIALLFGLTPLYGSIWRAIRQKKPVKWRSFWAENRWRIIAALIILVGSVVRLAWIGKYPVGLNQDEASIGYEAYSLLEHGVDRNGNSWPVHLVSWGSGQNALYAYLVMPFIAILGRRTLAIRLPMALIGCITLVVIYFTARRALGEKKGAVFLLMLAIMPWHIMKSRWGLESNVFPDMIIWAIAAIYYGVKSEGGWKWFVLASVLLGLSTYAYGTAYFFVPLLCVLVFGYLVVKKNLYWKKAILYVGLAGLVALPMVVFVIINYFGLESVKVAGITIPRLDYNRFTELSSAGGGLIVNSLRFWKETAGIIWQQQDGLVLNTMEGYGIYYLFSLPFLVIGVICAVKSRELFWKLVNCIAVASLLLCGFVEPNINRINTLWLPLLFYVANGVWKVVKERRVFARATLGCFLVTFGLFVYDYFGSYQKALGETNATFDGLGEAILATQDLNYEKLYISDKVNQPYIYYLWWTGYDPTEFLGKREIEDEKVMFQKVLRVERVEFYLPTDLTAKNVYIMENDVLSGFENVDRFERLVYGNYSVLKQENV